jgi:hypothetical protein
MNKRRDRAQYVLYRYRLDAYLEEELYDLITYCIQSPPSSPDYESKKERIQEIGKELFADGGVDSMENMYFAIQNRIKEEIQKDVKPYRSWWNDITDEWKY